MKAVNANIVGGKLIAKVDPEAVTVTDDKSKTAAKAAPPKKGGKVETVEVEELTPEEEEKLRQ